ncbi:hypothetical protein [Rhodovulum steppense]|uniref:Uncharacterized protein n=1 Tax=Rhodovulum steppense TaxID=540251 RepID=A0A4R1YYG5_9RHOB|nr:hypothetical protein [Rhodovulum steppense]TCM86127.1 hypothetical protein EV216_10592 [Rhodovulum steppense]
MTIEIGSLVVRGSFGQPRPRAAADDEALEERLRLFREELVAELQDMMVEAERRARER